jgi:hypothetical protein
MKAIPAPNAAGVYRAKDYPGTARKSDVFGPPHADGGDFAPLCSVDDPRDAQLIAEAFNSFLETGMTPRQLVEDRKALVAGLVACEVHSNELFQDTGESEYQDASDHARDLIARSSAKRFGWDVFDADGILQIQRVDEHGVFETDDEAIAHVHRLAAAGNTDAVQALSHHGMEATTVIYLTNACGEETGYGSGCSQDEVDKVPFEDGPGVVLPYLVQVGGRKYVLGNLEVSYKDVWLEPGDDYLTQESVNRYSDTLSAFIEPRLAEMVGARLLPHNKEMPGRVAIGVAIPLDSIIDRDDARQKLALAFGNAANLCDPKELGDYVEMKTEASLSP